MTSKNQNNDVCLKTNDRLFTCIESLLEIINIDEEIQKIDRSINLTCELMRKRWNETGNYDSGLSMRFNNLYEKRRKIIQHRGILKSTVRRSLKTLSKS